LFIVGQFLSGSWQHWSNLCVLRTASLFIVGQFVFTVSCAVSVRFVLLQSRLTGSCQVLWPVKAFPFRDTAWERAGKHRATA